MPSKLAIRRTALLSVELLVPAAAKLAEARA